MGFPGDSDGKESTCNAGDSGLIPGSEDPLEKGMATHSSILAWRIPWTAEPGGLQSLRLLRVGHDWATEPFDFPNFCTFSSRFFLLKKWAHSFLSPPFSWKPSSNIAKNHRLLTSWPFRNTGSLGTWVAIGTSFQNVLPLPVWVSTSHTSSGFITGHHQCRSQHFCSDGNTQFSVISVLALGPPPRQADSPMSEGWHIPAYGTVQAGSRLVGEDTRSFTHPGTEALSHPRAPGLPHWVSGTSMADCVFCLFLFILFYSTSRRMLVPRPGIGPVLPAVEVPNLNHWTTREVLRLVFLWPSVHHFSSQSIG